MLIALSPILIILYSIVRYLLGAPGIFAQQRPGLKGKPFTFYKFRSMSDELDSNGKPLPDRDRITVFGNFLRKTSIDELPSLLNVLKGDMSLVGPRPHLVEYFGLYTPEQVRRHDVKPGITGWAQINGRNSISWEDKFKLDVWYVDNQSLMLDIKIIFLTIWKVIKREGISSDNHATMEVFRGSDD